MGLKKPDKTVTGGGIVLPELTNPATPNEILTGYEALDGNGVLMTGSSKAVDTSDATASPEDIAAGKTVYVNGEKVTGTSTAVDTMDATASGSRILKGYTAYVKGQKVTGTHTCSSSGYTKISDWDVSNQAHSASVTMEGNVIECYCKDTTSTPITFTIELA